MFSFNPGKPVNAPYSPARKLACTALIMPVVLSLTFGMLTPAFGAIESDPNLAKLEKKFFDKEYPKDEIDYRLDRLEKLIFGEARTGEAAVRLKNLLAAVPNLNPSVTDDEDVAQTPDQSPGPAPSQAGRKELTPTAQPPALSQADPETQKDLLGTQYPQVTAMEKKVFGKDFSGEPVQKRLERLEVKTLGKAASVDDLSERVDRLKQVTGTDLAKNAPAGSDWADDDEDVPQGKGELTFIPPETTPYTSPAGEDGKSFSGRDLRADMQRAFGRPATGGNDATYGGSGSYGMGTTPRSTAPYTAGGAYGYGSPAAARPTTGNGVPMPAPDIVRSQNTAPPTAMGIKEQLSLMENELFGQNFNGDIIPKRLERLEHAVFPGQNPSALSLPQRMQKLAEAVPLTPPQAPKRLAHRQDPDFADLDNADLMEAPRPAPQRPSGLSKIVSGLGNLLGGGGGMYSTSGYPVATGALIRDPQTGMLFDRTTGNLIDPITGAIVSNRVTPGLGNGTVNSYGGFNNGFSPLGSPYGGYGTGMGGMNFGFGGSGMRFGSGMWP